MVEQREFHPHLAGPQGQCQGNRKEFPLRVVGKMDCRVPAPQGSWISPPLAGDDMEWLRALLGDTKPLHCMEGVLYPGGEWSEGTGGVGRREEEGVEPAASSVAVGVWNADMVDVERMNQGERCVETVGVWSADKTAVGKGEALPAQHN